MLAAGARLLAAVPRRLYNHNPFYVVSALVVLYGLRIPLAAHPTAQSLALVMLLLAGYTILLAVAGYVIVRFGQVWQDARTVLLVILLLLVALSTSFDHVALDQPGMGAWFQAGGLAFSVALSEGVLRSLRMRLAARYRVPYYLLLALLFAYPVGLAQLSVSGYERAMSLAVFLFPVAGAAGLLALVPAARAGGRGEAPSGTPWQWPWYPWPLFVLLATGICLRTYWLSAAFDPSLGLASSFRLYFLAPVMLACALLLFELAGAGGSAGVRRFALVAPAALVAVAFPGSGANPVEVRFLTLLTETMGSPAELTLYGLIVFYVITLLRGCRGAELGVVAGLLALSVVDRGTLNINMLCEPRTWPLAVLAAAQLALGVWRRSAWRLWLGSLCAATAARNLIPPLGTNTAGLYIAVHGAVVLLLVLAVHCNDPLARAVRRASWLLIPFAGLVAALAYPVLFSAVPVHWNWAYIALLAAVGWLHWRRNKSLRHLLGQASTWSALALALARRAYLLLQATLLDGAVPWLACGLGLLLLAVLISAVKGRLVARAWMALLHWQADVPRAPSAPAEAGG